MGLGSIKNKLVLLQEVEQVHSIFGASPFNIWSKSIQYLEQVHFKNAARPLRKVHLKNGARPLKKWSTSILKTGHVHSRNQACPFQRCLIVEYFGTFIFLLNASMFFPNLFSMRDLGVGLK